MTQYIPIVVPTGKWAPCQLRHIIGTFTRLGGLASYLDVEPENPEEECIYELRITSRGKQQWFMVKEGDQ